MNSYLFLLFLFFSAVICEEQADPLPQGDDESDSDESDGEKDIDDLALQGDDTLPQKSDDSYFEKSRNGEDVMDHTLTVTDSFPEKGDELCCMELDCEKDINNSNNTHAASDESNSEVVRVQNFIVRLSKVGREWGTNTKLKISGLARGGHFSL